MPKNTTLILVDGSSYLFRAYHALPPLTNRDGMATGAIYGVINMLKKLQSDHPEAPIAVIFDTKGKTFRDEIYPEYKANREAMPDELAGQIAPLHAVIKAMGLPLIAIEGVEADDVIGTLAKQTEHQLDHIIIATGDKDMAQLVNDKITLLNTMTDKILDIDGVIEKFGVTPHQIIDYLSLMGDKVDNIPGIPNVGPKTAAKWLTQYDTLENVIHNKDAIKGKAGENLKNHCKQLPLSKQLVTIKCDVDLSLSLSDLMPKAPNHAELIHWFETLEFKRWLKDEKEKTGLSGSNAPTQTNKKHYETILTPAHFQTWLKQLENAELFAFDTETTSLNYIDAEIVGLSFAITPYEAAYIPLAHNYPGAPQQCNRDSVLQALKPLLENPDQQKIGQHSKYDMNVLANYGITLRGVAYDTMLESYIVNSTSQRHDMTSLARAYLNEETTSFEDIAGKGAKQLTFNEIEIDKASHYAAEDADITLRLHLNLYEKLKETPSLLPVFTDIECPLIPVLAKMEQQGVLIDTRQLVKQKMELQQRLDQLTKDAFELAGTEFNLASPKQLQTILFDKMQLPILKKTPKGQPSTAEETLQTLAIDYPLPKIILEHRQLSKLLSTYVEKLPEQVHAKTKRVHTSYHQAVTATGRLSSSDPNLQNIPVRTPEGRRIRRAFIAPKHYQLLAADYSQIELRIMAHLSQDQALLNAFKANADIHRATAAEVFSCDLKDVSHDQRRSAKAINFGLIYGMSAFGLSKQLHINSKQAQQYIDCYFKRYPGVKQYMETTREQAREKGFVETLFGRRLYLPDLKSRNVMRQKAAERTAINAPLQGTAADIIKQAMIRIDEWLTQADIDAHLIMQVHDELVFEVHQKDVVTLREKLPELMNNFHLSVPLLIDIGIADNWDEAH